ncbi:MAG: polysaccharide pyruvyl transferase family protein [Lachnospiraceae bacterium]|nr:polysaccharide pyruvyl transferase family protein [Lachnospiraceae bacterium]
MKIAIMTWFHYINYGTVLQAYALQRYLRDQGHEVYLINYVGEDKKSSMNLKNIIERIKRKAKNTVINARYSESLSIRKKTFHDWLIANCNLTQPLKNSDLCNLEKEFDLFICGSDQIWHASTAELFEKEYFLDFVKDTSKKVSYAPSFGQSYICKSIEPQVKKLISDFRMLSVREETGAEIIKNLTGKKPYVVADPVLLLDTEKWRGGGVYAYRVSIYFLLFSWRTCFAI